MQDLFIRSDYKSYKTLGPEACQLAVYINNRVLTKRTHESLRRKTPFEIVHGTKPDVGNNRIFGTSVKFLIPRLSKGKKFHRKTWDVIHVGYADGNSYRSFLPSLERILITKDVTFYEKLYRPISEKPEDITSEAERMRLTMKKLKI